MFDYDGVIADSLKIHVENFLAALHENGFTQITTQEELLDLYEDNVYASLMAYGLEPEQIEEILAAYEKKQSRYLGQIQLFPGIPDALQKIAEKNKVFIITSNLSQAIWEVLDRFQIHCIADVIGAEKEKSKIVKIRRLINEYKDLIPYYIGDTKGDILEGRAAGAKTVGVAWGWHGAERLSQACPDYTAFTPEDLARYFSR